ncbi:uncharacterized protein LOC132205696 [Neocloeon triangulifer]|uniref:uncharacterized protein LOC132205696 n=1 Tax=Neocloeon triangulifer TaxID=2078957 RepID=UPI00286ECD43|nr:uncharacterized protein LOC132205696 [Neocloeon triangulifer]
MSLCIPDTHSAESPHPAIMYNPAYYGAAAVAQDRGYSTGHFLGGFDPIGLLAGLSFISFLLHALLSFLFRPSAHSAGYYLPHGSAASSRQGESTNAHNLLDSAIDYYESLNDGAKSIKNRH